MKRVKVKDYGRIAYGDPRLVVVPSIKGRQCLLHWAAADMLAELELAWMADTGNTTGLVCSGWRRHKWRSWAHYESFVKRKYGSLAEGRKWMAYDSPHETALAVDFGNHGLWPSRLTVKKQRLTERYDWLKKNAETYHFFPYGREAWHWECVVPLRIWAAKPS